MSFRAVSVIVFSVILVLCTMNAARAATTLTISPSGNATFLVQGADLEKVAGIEIVIGYDSTTMANPRVIQGNLISGALMVSNTNQTGSVRIGVINAYPKVKSGTGTIVVIPYDPLGGSPGKITYFTATMVDVHGAPLSAQAIIVPGDTTASTSATGGTTGSARSTGTPSTTGGTPVVVGGSVTLPSDGGLTPGKAREEALPVQAEDGSKGTTGAPAESEAREGQQGRVAALPPAQSKVTVHKSVLERFREFQGEKTPKALMALFTTTTMPGISQEPAVALSDGKTNVKVFIDLSAAGKENPHFTLRGAQLVSIKLMKNSTWVVEVLPEPGVYNASITVLHSQFTTEIPLAIAPGVAISTGKTGTTDEAGFAFFLKERGSEKAPRFDLNGDGVRNYIDDYIFTANYLVQQGSKSPATDKKTP